MSEPPKKKPKQEKKKPKLNLHAKALFISHTPRTIKKYEPTVDDYLKFPKISKQFLFATNSHRIYSLKLYSFSDQKYEVWLKIQKNRVIASYLTTFTSNFKKLKNLSKWLHIEFLSIHFSSGSDKKELNKEICGFRRVWSKLYPYAKINLERWSSDDYRTFDIIANLLEELSGRLHNLECHSEILIKTNAKLTLNKCVLRNRIAMEELKKLMQKEHKIKKLKFTLERKDCSSDLWWEKPLILHKNLDNFPTNFALKELEIVYFSRELGEKVFDISEFEALLAFFPNLAKFKLDLNYWYDTGREEAVGTDFEKDVKKPMSSALNFIQKLRVLLAQKRPMIELEISYDFSITDAKKIGFEAFDEWAKSLPNHSEFDGIEKIGPAPNSSHTYDFKLKEGEYYKIVDKCHIIALGWKHGNFMAKIEVLIEDKQDDEEMEE